MKFSLKKVVSLLVVLVFIVSVFAGCGSNSSSTTTTTTTTTTSSSAAASTQVATPKPEVTISFCAEAELQQNTLWTDAAARFEQNNAGKVKINWLYIPSAQRDEKMKVMLLGGDSFDVAYVGPGLFPFFRDGGYLAPLDDVITNAGYKLDDMIPLATEKDGKIYGIDWDVPTPWSLIYNKAIFDKAGVPYPDSKVPMTWSQMSDVAKKLTSGTGKDKVYGYLIPNQWVQLTFNSAVQTASFYKADGTSNLDDPAFSIAAKFTNNMLNVDKSAQSWPDVVTKKIDTVNFMSGNYGMIIQGAWIYNWLIDKKGYPRTWKAGCAPIPQADGATSVISFGTATKFVVPTTSKYPAEALYAGLELFSDFDSSRGGKPVLKKWQKADRFADMASKLADDGITEDILKSTLDPENLKLVPDGPSGGKIDSQYNSILFNFGLGDFFNGKTTDADKALVATKAEVDKAIAAAK